MAVSVKLPKNLVEDAKRIAKVNKVSVSKDRKSTRLNSSH